MASAGAEAPADWSRRLFARPDRRLLLLQAGRTVEAYAEGAGWTPHGPQQHDQHPGYEPTRAAQAWQQQQARPKSTRTLYTVLGGFFLLSMYDGMTSAMLAASNTSRGAAEPVAVAVPSPSPAAEQETDRKANSASLDTTEFRTKSGYVMATSKDKVQTAMALVAAGDKAAFGKFLHSTPGVSLTAGNDIVSSVDSDGMLGSLVRIRKRGETASFWTVREAIER